MIDPAEREREREREKERVIRSTRVITPPARERSSRTPHTTRSAAPPQHVSLLAPPPSRRGPKHKPFESTGTVQSTERFLRMATDMVVEACLKSPRVQAAGAAGAAAADDKKPKQLSYVVVDAYAKLLLVVVSETANKLFRFCCLRCCLICS